MGSRMSTIQSSRKKLLIKLYRELTIIIVDKLISQVYFYSLLKLLLSIIKWYYLNYFLFIIFIEFCVAAANYTKVL